MFYIYDLFYTSRRDGQGSRYKPIDRHIIDIVMKLLEVANMEFIHTIVFCW